MVSLESEFSVWSSTDMLQIYLPKETSYCIFAVRYTIQRNSAPHGYSLQLARNLESNIYESDYQAAQWTSDVFSVNVGIVCLIMDFTLPSSVQAILFQQSQNGTVWNQSVFSSGSDTDDRISGMFQVSLDRDAAQIQLSVDFRDNATIYNISLEFGPCNQNAPVPRTNLSCNFMNLDSCGYRDASGKESRWVATASQANLTGIAGRHECMSDADGRSYVGRQNVTFSGRPCLHWTQEDPDIHVFGDVSYFSDSFFNFDQAILLEDISNYCRNPSFAGTYEIWPWCYVNGSSFRKEYCPVPFCQEYVMKVVLGKNVDTSVLLSPPIQLNKTVCLQFQYRLSHPTVILSVQTTNLSTPLSSQKLIQLNYQMQVNTSNWNSVNVTLNSTYGRVHQVTFVAEKIGFTLDPEYAAIRNMIMTDSSCPQPGQHEDKEKYTGHRQPSNSFRQLVLNDTSQYNMGDVVRMLGHRQDRLIYTCHWNGAVCNETDIRSELTDLGLCYTFNGDENRILSSDKTGATFGLRLMLNVEQYENIPIYNQSTGIKIHLHNYDDIPEVADSGFTVAPGYQTLAPLDYQTGAYLGPPWGRCSSTDYEFFNSTDRYTTAKCQLECKTRSVLAKCGCKDVYMPGIVETCSVDDSLSCLESSNDRSLCNCPDECLVFSYATALSSSQLSAAGFANIFWNTNSIRESYWQSLEIAHRVDDVELTQTIVALDAVIASHRQVKALIYQNIVNPPTSVTSLVLRAVDKFMEFVKKDVDSSQFFLDKFQSYYREKVRMMVQMLSDQLRYVSMQLLKWQSVVIDENLAIDQYPELKNVLDRLSKALSVVTEYLDCATENSFCPGNFLMQRCVNFVDAVYFYASILRDLIPNDCVLTTVADNEMPSKLTSRGSSASELPNSPATPAANISPVDNSTSDPIPSSTTSPSSSASTDSSSAGTANSSSFCVQPVDPFPFIQPNQAMIYVQSVTSDILSCMLEYDDYLKAFKSFLDSVDLTVSAVDMASTTRSMNTLSVDASWLDDLMVTYQNGSLTKRKLSDEFLKESTSRLLFHVENALSGIESSFLSDVTSIINKVETSAISFYTQLIMNLNKLQTFMPVDGTAVYNFSRELLLWRSPIPKLHDKTIAEFRLAPNDIEEVIGVDRTIAALFNRSATIVPKIVSAYDSYLKQTLTNVQLELRAAQQMVLDSVNNLTQQLTSFDDSTIIGDSFVRNNFLEVDIFYGELKYRTIEQTTGYDIVQFLSDFGGCFGLFLGGSILSFFEFLDLLIYNLIGKMSNRKIRMTTTTINVRPSPEVQNPRPRSGVKVHPLPDNDDPSLESIRIE